MDYGLTAYSNDDASLICSSDTENAFFAGKMTHYGSTLGPYDRWFNHNTQYLITYHYFRIEGITTSPIAFATTVANQYISTGSLYYSAPYWYLTVVARGSAHATIPEVYAFVSSEEYAGTTPAADYGLQLKNATGDTTFDSRWAKKLLVLSDVRSYTATPGYSTTLAAGITKPAVAFASKYFNFYQPDLYYLNCHTLGVSCFGTTISIASVLTGMLVLLFNGSSTMYDNGMFGPAPAGYIPLQIDWSSAPLGVVNSGLAGQLPIIDGTYYD